MYAGFYWSVCLYPNALWLDYEQGEWFWLALYITLHSASIWYFLTSGSNPGFVEQDGASTEDEEMILNIQDTSGEKDIELGTIQATEEVKTATVENRAPRPDSSRDISSQPSFECIREL